MTTGADDRLLPRYADGSGEAWWDFEWGSVLVAPNDKGIPTISVDLSLECQDIGLSTTMGRQLAKVMQTACDAADGKPLGWIQFRAEAAPPGPTDPDVPGMWRVGPGHWEGPTRLSETFDASAIEDFLTSRTAADQIVTIHSRTFHTLTDVSPWMLTPPRPGVCSDGIAS